MNIKGEEPVPWEALVIESCGVEVINKENIGPPITLARFNNLFVSVPYRPIPNLWQEIHR